MTRMIRSSVLLAACLGLWSCTSDPTADEAGVPTAIVASPAVAFVTKGASELVKFGLVRRIWAGSSRRPGPSATCRPSSA